VPFPGYHLLFYLHLHFCDGVPLPLPATCLFVSGYTPACLPSVCSVPTTATTAVLSDGVQDIHHFLGHLILFCLPFWFILPFHLTIYHWWATSGAITCHLGAPACLPLWVPHSGGSGWSAVQVGAVPGGWATPPATCLQCLPFPACHSTATVLFCISGVDALFWRPAVPPISTTVTDTTCILELPFTPFLYLTAFRALFYHASITWNILEQEWNRYHSRYAGVFCHFAGGYHDSLRYHRYRAPAVRFLPPGSAASLHSTILIPITAAFSPLEPLPLGGFSGTFDSGAFYRSATTCRYVLPAVTTVPAIILFWVPFWIQGGATTTVRLLPACHFRSALFYLLSTTTITILPWAAFFTVSYRLPANTCVHSTIILDRYRFYHLIPLPFCSSIHTTTCHHSDGCTVSFYAWAGSTVLPFLGARYHWVPPGGDTYHFWVLPFWNSGLPLF